MTYQVCFSGAKGLTGSEFCLVSDLAATVARLVAAGLTVVSVEEVRKGMVVGLTIG